MTCCYFLVPFPLFIPIHFCNASHSWTAEVQRPLCSQRVVITEQDGMCHLATWIGATCPWPRLSWRSGIISAFLHLFFLWLFHETLEWFPKRLSICSGSCPYFASLQPSGSEAAAVSPPAPIPPLPPHVPCLRWDSAHNDPVKKTQVICLRSTLHSLSPKQLRGDVGAPPWVSKSSF